MKHECKDCGQDHIGEIEELEAKLVQYRDELRRFKAEGFPVVLRDLALDRERAEVEKLTKALTKIDAIRNSIVAHQSVSFSEHIYPLVAALDEAGFTGLSYTDARESLSMEKDKGAE